MSDGEKIPLSSEKNGPAAGLRTHYSVSNGLPGPRPPLPHQERPNAFLAEKDRVAILLDKRLGKCPVSIRWTLSRKSRRILIVAPKSAIPGWMNELEADHQQAWLIQEERHIELARHILENQTNADSPFYFITNPQKLYSPAGRKVRCDSCTPDNQTRCDYCGGTGKVRRNAVVPGPICLLPWDAIIWDEATNIRNPKAQITAIAQSAFRDIPRKAILSGELVVESELDVFEPMKFLFGHFMGKKNYYAFRHDNFQKVGYEWHTKPNKMAEIKTCLAARSVRLTRKEAGLETIPPTFEKRYAELPSKILKAYKHVEKYFELPPVGAFPGAEFKQAVVGRSYLVQLASGYPKNPQTGELIEELSSDHKVKVLKEILEGDYHNQQLVILFRHNLELAAVNQAVAKWGYTSRWITGAISDANERREIGKRFNRGDFQLLLMQIKVAKFGIDLSAADVMIRFSLSDSYEDVSQSMDRTAHPLKVSQRHYIDIVATDTYDEDIVNAWGEKKIRADYFRTRLKENFYKRTGFKLPEATR